MADPEPTFCRMENSFGLVQSDSMDLQNDPRFFQDNVLNKRQDSRPSHGAIHRTFVGRGAI